MFRARFLKMLFLVSMLVLMGGAAPIVGAATVTQSGSVEKTLTFDGRDRTYRVHAPEMTAPARGFPVLIVLHGGGGNGKIIERVTGFSDLADREGFIAVYPDGTGQRSQILTWNAHNCCGYAYAKDVDDVGFISALIDQLVVEYDVDPSRIYVTGHSNGAMMTFRVACELSDKIAAAAPYAGALNTDSCPATDPVPMLIMNGDADENVPVAGGTSVGVGVASQDGRVDQPTSHAVDTWTSIDGCDPNPLVTDSPAAQISDYQNCANGSTVEQVLIHGWAHGWPVPDKGSPIDGSQQIWAFLSQFEKPDA